MERLCVLVGGYYPHCGNPMGIVLSKLCPLLARAYSVSVITLRNVSAPPVKRRIVHDGVEITTLTSWFRRAIERRRTVREMACYKMADYNFFSCEIFNSCHDFLASVLSKSGILDYALVEGVQGRRPGRYFDSGKVNLVFAGGAGRLMRDSSYFVEVFSRLPKTVDCVLHLWLLSSLAAFFEKGISELGDRVVLHSPVPPEEMQEIMREADILVNLGNDSDVFSPSKLFDYVSTGRPLVCTTYANRHVNEILTRIPNVLILENYSDADKDARRLALFCERMMGVPCVVTDVGGVQTILKNGEQGILVPSADPAILAHEISRLFEDRELARRFAVAGQADAVKRYNPKTVVDQLLAAYREVAR